jgi:hypothetical protein
VADRIPPLASRQLLFRVRARPDASRGSTVGGIEGLSHADVQAGLALGDQAIGPEFGPGSARTMTALLTPTASRLPAPTQQPAVNRVKR